MNNPGQNKSEDVMDVLNAEANRLTNERDRLRAALAFYADPANYHQPKPFATPLVEADRGDTAREALTKDVE